jgi:hypothetical protein
MRQTSQCLHRDQRQQAHTALTAAIDLYRTMGMTFWLHQAEMALMQVEEGGRGDRRSGIRRGRNRGVGIRRAD